MTDEKRARFRFEQGFHRASGSPKARDVVLVGVASGASGVVGHAVLHFWPGGWVTLLVSAAVLVAVSVSLAIWRRRREDVRYIEYLEAEEAARARDAAEGRDEADIP
jgi:hypothetical protein